MYWFPQWEKLQRHSEEVRERAETAECQIAAISQEYRKLIQEKDVRINNVTVKPLSKGHLENIEVSFIRR